MFSHRTPIRAIVVFSACTLVASGIFIPGLVGSDFDSDSAQAGIVVRDQSLPVVQQGSGMRGRPASFIETVCEALSDGRSFISQRNPPDVDAPKVSRKIPAFPISTSHPDWPTFKKYATLAAAGKNNNGLTIMDVAQVWAANGRHDNSMRDWCVGQLRKKLVAALERWNANQNVTAFSADSYLYCGDQVAAWVIVLNWFGDQLTSQEKSDAAMILEQAIWNIWNPTKAKWGTKVYGWSGWGTANPWNNYFYRAHWRATLWWAIHSQSQTWLAKLTDYCIPLLKKHYAKLVDGGSLEGTGYGSAYWQLFQDIWLTREALGVDLTTDCRVAEHIDYWVQATTPDYKSIAQIGDTPSTVIKDAHRAIVVWGILLCPKTPEAAHGRWWLSKAGARASRPEFMWMTCYDTTGTVTAPDRKSYFAKGVGHVFARSQDGSFLSMQAGEFRESHDHADQGEVQIYLPGGWKFVTANKFSHSGIIQTVNYHNCVMFRTAAGKQINPHWFVHTPPVMTVHDDGNSLRITVDLKKAYDNAPDITTYTRTLTWDRAAKKCRISDDFTTKNGVTGTWRGTLADRPVQQSDGSIMAGALRIRCNAKALPPVNWRTEARPKTFDKDCWRIEFTDSNKYEVEISW